MRRSVAIMRAAGLYAALMPGWAMADSVDDIIKLFGRDPGDSAAYSCFKRHYTKAHLASHPQQNVTDMIAYVGKPEGAETYYTLNMQVNFRHLKKPFQVSGGCSAAVAGAPKLECGVECDGGHLAVRAKNESSILVEIPNSVRMFDPDDAEESQEVPKHARFGADDKLFRLDRTDLADCLPIIYDDELKAKVQSGAVRN